MSETGNRHDDAQHAAMGRVRELLERDRIGGEQAARHRPWWPRLLGLALALGVVSVFALGLNAFLAVYQRYLNAPADEPTPGATPAPDQQSAMPVFVVPEDDTDTAAKQPAQTPADTAGPAAPETPEPASH
jgi:hypothetical protein